MTITVSSRTGDNAFTYGARGTYIIKPKEVEVRVKIEKSLVYGDELTASDVKYLDNEFNYEWGEDVEIVY